MFRAESGIRRWEGLDAGAPGFEIGVRTVFQLAQEGGGHGTVGGLGFVGFEPGTGGVRIPGGPFVHGGVGGALADGLGQGLSPGGGFVAVAAGPVYGDAFKYAGAGSPGFMGEPQGLRT
jgi:hypothetical protein